MDAEYIYSSIVVLLVVAAITFLANRLFKNRQKVLGFYKRIEYYIFPAKFDIALSLDFNEGLNSGVYYDQIVKNLKNSIIQRNLQKVVRIKDFTNIHAFNSPDQAEKYRSDTGISLIIWGGFSNDNLKEGGEVVNSIDLKFTFGYPGNNKALGKMILADFNSNIAKKDYWRILENESLKDVTTVSENLFHLSSYMLAVVLKLFGHVEKSIDILEGLINRRNDKDDFMQSVEIHLINCYELLTVERGRGHNDFNGAISYCKKILALNQKSFFGLSNIAYYYYKSNLIEEAKDIVDQLKRYYSDMPVTYIDLAFFSLLNRDNKSAYKYYNRLLKYRGVDFNAIEISSFLEAEYKRKKIPGLLYGSGFISYHFGDRASGISDLRQFLKESKSIDCPAMVKKATSLIKKY